MTIGFEALNIISAGAGSGKTYTVQQTLSQWLQNHPDKVRPERILAVTFTNMAASEMQSRIRAALLSSGNVEAAMKVASAQISTIHSFGQNIIRSFAYETGLSPNVRQLSEAEENILLRLSLSSHEQISQVIKNLESLGYKGRYNGKEYINALDILQGRVLQLSASLRTIGADEEKTLHYIETLSKELVELYGPTEDETKLNNALHDAVIALHSNYPENMKDTYGGNTTADSAFTNEYKTIKKAQDINNIASDWTIWKTLQTLRTTKIKDEAYLQLAESVMAAANKLSVHPGPLREALLHIKTLLQISMETLHKYAEAKRTNALMDFSDMVHLANKTMNDGMWLDEMASMYDCLVIDEFQDTNPIQFALLWKFRQKGLPTLIVGDLKQSIMGFQGADSSLFESLIVDTKANQYELESNWRSKPALMQWINAMGKGIYGKRYTHLEPKAKYPSELASLKIIDFDDDNWSANGTKNGKGGYTQGQYDVVASQINCLLAEKAQVYDRHSKQLRSIEPSDIAILAPSHSMLGKAAATLRQYGIEAEVKQQGWFTSRIIQIAFHALSYLANPHDRHAALYLLVTEFGDMSLQDALQMYLDEKKFNHELLEMIDGVRETTKTHTLSRKLITLIETLQMWDYVQKHEDNVAQRANLLKLVELSSEFESLQHESLNAMGIYGRSISAFLSWIAINDKADDQPSPKSINTEAVQLRTWHASKGLEWPVVIVMGLDKNKSPSLPDISLGYEDESRTDPLANAYVRFFTQFDDDTSNERLLEALSKEAHATVDNLLYVAMTRAREQLILPWPSFNTTPNEFSFMYRLQNRCQMTIKKDRISMAHLEESGEFSAVVELAKLSGPEDLRLQATPMIYGRAAIEMAIAQKRVPTQIFPSGLESAITVNTDAIQLEPYSSEVKLSDIEMEASALGTLLHQYYHIMLQKPQLKERFIKTVDSLISSDLFDSIANQAAAFKSFAEDNLKVIGYRCEVPILNKSGQGSIVSGSTDLLMETEDGYWIIDHKSDSATDLLQQFFHHYPQLEAYKNIVNLDKPVIGVGINWIRYGKITITKIL